MRTTFTVSFLSFVLVACGGGNPPSPMLLSDGSMSVAGDGSPEGGFAGNGATAGMLGMDTAGTGSMAGTGAAGSGAAGTDADASVDTDSSVSDPDSAVPDPDAGTDSGPTIECTFNVDCDDGNECTTDTCTDHVCSNSAADTEGDQCESPGGVAFKGTCHAGGCCGGCYDPVLGCMDDYKDTQDNIAACGINGSICKVCQDPKLPYCSSGKCCDTLLGC